MSHMMFTFQCKDFLSKDELLDEIVIYLGGAAAEELMFGTYGTIEITSDMKVRQ